MKRILSAFSVITIVGSAFAFAPTKGGVYCASTVQNVGCALAVQRTESANDKPHGIYYKYNNWNGSASDCLPTRCETATILYNEI